uniref:ATP synthase epsilon chain, chloroplastic n=1 Tax=Pseudobryopsis hainanensis TaxID=2320808 RepID=A0A3S7SZ57_9CHLO|nr:ATP synthase CF1 subunit epsilon [Pseudobryopsis hainanensis]
MVLTIRVITPDKIFLNQQASEVIIPTNTGQMGILTGHAPLITAVDVGVMLMRVKDTWESIALMGGFALIKQNQLTVLVNSAESPETLDRDQVEQAFSRAQQSVESATTAKEKVEAMFALKRARARYQIIQ